MLLIHTTERHREPESGFLAISWFSFHRAEPAQVVLQVARGHTAKLMNPAFETAVVCIDVLLVPGAVFAAACRKVDGMMLDTELACCAGQSWAAAGAKYDVPRQERLQRGRQRRHVHCLQDTIHRRTGAIPCNQHRHLLVRQSALGGTATALARRPTQAAALSLERQQEHRFVSFGNAGQRSRLDDLGLRQEPMSPAVRRADVDSKRVRYLV